MKATVALMLYESTPLLASAVALMAGALALVTLSVRLRLSPVLGYFAAGIVLGPHGAGVLPDTSSIALFADLGVALLMFMVGLEFSPTRIWESRHAIFGIGMTQVLLVTGAVAVVCLWLTDASPFAATIVGAAVAMSSTAVSLKQLSDQHELLMRHGRLAIAILLFQDVVTLPILFAIGVAATDAALLSADAWSRTVGGVLAATFVVLAIRLLWRPATAWLANQESSELLQLAALLLALGAAFVAREAGLPSAVGAFLAGLTVGDSEHKHHVERQLQPFRDLLVGVFFISVGVQFNTPMLLTNGVEALALAFGIVSTKAVLTSLTLFVFRQTTEVSLRVAAVLAHGGEFSLLLLGLSAAAGIVPATMSQPLLLAIGLTIFMAPILIRFNGQVGALVLRTTDRQPRKNGR